jgi:hypothetical protein
MPIQLNFNNSNIFMSLSNSTFNGSIASDTSNNLVIFNGINSVGSIAISSIKIGYSNDSVILQKHSNLNTIEFKSGGISTEPTTIITNQITLSNTNGNTRLQVNNSNDLIIYNNSSYGNLQANYIKLGTLPNEGHFRYNSNVRWFEGYNGVDWYALNGTLSAALANINYTFSGTLTEAPYALVTPPPPILSNGYIADFSGKWVSTIQVSSSNSGLTSITFTDLQGITASFTPNTLPALATLSLPTLTTIVGTYAPSTMNGMTNLNLPILNRIGGSFSPNNMSTISTITIPNLISVGGNFSPSTMSAITAITCNSLSNIGSNFSPNTMSAITGLNFANLNNIGGNFNINNMNALANMNFPSVERVDGNFNPNTTPALTNMTFTNFKTISGSFIPSTMIAITSMNFSTLSNVNGDFIPTNMNALTSVSFSALTYIGSNFSPSIMNGLVTANFPSIITIGRDVSPNTMVALTTLGLDSLTTVNGNFNPNHLDGLTNLSVSSLTTIGGNFTMNICSGLITSSFPSLAIINGNFNPSNFAALTTLTLGSIVRIGVSSQSGSIISITQGCGNLTTFTLGTTLKQIGNTSGNVIITSAVLSAASVNALLLVLASLDGTNGTTQFSNRVVTITGTSAPPSGDGITAKNTLIGRGCSVTTN